MIKANTNCSNLNNTALLLVKIKYQNPKIDVSNLSKNQYYHFFLTCYNDATEEYFVIPYNDARCQNFCLLLICSVLMCHYVHLTDDDPCQQNVSAKERMAKILLCNGTKAENSFQQSVNRFQRGIVSVVFHYISSVYT